MSSDSQRHIEHLAREIGPRPTTSAAERRAADYVSLELEQFADEVAVESFGGLTTFVWMYLTLFLLALIANATFFGNPKLAFVASLAVIVFLNQEVNAKGFFYEFFPKRESQNVIGVIEAARQPKRRVIITANLDTGRDGVLFRPALRRNFRTLLSVTVSALILQVTFSLLALFVGPQPYILVTMRALGLIELATVVVLLLHRYTGQYAPGANDNASGVAAMLTVGRQLAASRLPDTEVWLVATGGGRSTQSGIIAFLRRHWSEVRGDWFITLNHVGAGRLAYTLGEGLLKLYAVDPDLIERARAIADANPDWEIGEVLNRVEATDLVPLLAMGLRAISLRGEGPDGFGVRACSPGDRPETIDGAVLERASAFALALARAVGRPLGEGDEQEENQNGDDAADGAGSGESGDGAGR